MMPNIELGMMKRNSARMNAHYARRRLCLHLVRGTCEREMKYTQASA
jgi:hypothetical protein